MLEDIDVAHITFSRSGGAGVVAARLHAALNSGGVSSGLYFQSAKSLREAPLESPALTILAALDDWVVRARDNYLGQISRTKSLLSWVD